MFKKLLKSCLAIAAVCALSATAFGETSVSASANATFAMYDGAFTSTFDGMIQGFVNADKVSGMTWLDISSERGLAPFFANVSWKAADSVTLKIGSEIVPGSSGYVSDGNHHPGSGSLSYFGTHAPVGSYVFLNEGLHAAIGMGDMNIYAGIIEDTGAGMTPYAYFGGMFGSINLTAGAKMNAGTDMGMVVAVKMGLGDAMTIAVDYHMQGTANVPAASFQMKELGPGDLGIAMSMPSAGTVTFLNYGIALAPGEFLDIFVNSSTVTEMGIGLAKLF